MYPKTAGTLCARMSRGLNGQDAAGDLLVVLQILPGGGISGTLDASYYKGTGTRNGKEREFIAVSIGNGQTNNIGMNEQANTLDCMHDAQAVVYPGVGITSKENASNPQPGDPAPTISTDSRNYLAEKENDIAKTRNKELQTLWETYGAEAVQQWGTGMLELLQQKGLLLNGLPKSGPEGEKSSEWNELECYSQICATEEARRLLRDLRESGENRCASCRPQSTEQQPRESSTPLQKLPQSDSQEGGRLLDMWESGQGIWLLQQTLYSFQEVWRPVRNNVSEVPRRTQKRKYIVRRLTPLETLRLQGLPDWWVDGANGSDSAIYKMAGNGIAIPCAEDVLGRIADALREEELHSSEDLI